MEKPLVQVIFDAHFSSLRVSRCTIVLFKSVGLPINVVTSSDFKNCD